MTEAAALARLAAARASLDALDAPDAPGRLTVVARGYATLDLDEAQTNATRSITHHEVRSAADDTLLGARCRIVVTVDGPWIVLLEPSTEGRLAASLARHGPGPVVEYLAPAAPGEEAVAAAARARIPLSPPAGGPLGKERLVLGNPAWGPHLILLDEPPAGAPGPPPATIEW